MLLKRFEFQRETWEAYLASPPDQVDGVELLFVARRGTLRAPLYVAAADVEVLNRFERGSPETVESVLRSCLEQALAKGKIADAGREMAAYQSILRKRIWRSRHPSRRPAWSGKFYPA